MFFFIDTLHNVAYSCLNFGGFMQKRFFFEQLLMIFVAVGIHTANAANESLILPGSTIMHSEDSVPGSVSFDVVVADTTQGLVVFSSSDGKLRLKYSANLIKKEFNECLDVLNLL